MPRPPAVQFEVGASVTLVGRDLQFVGMVNTTRVRFLISNDAMKRLAGRASELTPQEKFRVYDRNRAWLQDIARRLYEQAPSKVKVIKIGAKDL